MKDLVIADIRVLPFGTGTASISDYVAACVRVLRRLPNIEYQVTPMATVLQGSLASVLEALQEMHEVPFTMGVSRVVTNISIDDRRDKRITMDTKVMAVAEKLEDSPEVTLAGIISEPAPVA